MLTEYLLRYEVVLMFVAVFAYAGASLTEILGVFLERPALERVALAVLLAGLAVQSAAMLMRWYGVGHGPYITRYEILSSNAWFTAVTYLLVARLRPALRRLALIAYPAVFLIVGLALYTGSKAIDLPPTAWGTWLILHVIFYFSAFATALIAVTAAVLHLGGDREWTRRLRGQADAETLDRVSYRFAGLAFSFWGIGMLTGSIWAYYSWGSYWSWDPVETWSLITWVTFGLYLHLRRFFSWKGTRAAALLAVCFALAIVSLFFASLISGSLHGAYFVS